jgi:DNA (cytosine-5)-methyltransferase 1
MIDKSSIEALNGNFANTLLPAVHLFPYRWTLKDANFTKDKGKVFSCFACGGGSTMGYKLAGFDVIGCNEIDPKMIEAYKTNHNPKYAYLEPIQTFKLRDDLPQELYELDILDGSPPCSSFSMAGNREKDWGKEKVFREGQAEQILDTLFFDFIDLAKKLQPKVVIAENVKGLLLGEAKNYVREIYREFDLAGYYVQHWLLDASKMGVPQRRERVFFIALRKDLATPFLYQKDMFTVAPKLELKFNEKGIKLEQLDTNLKGKHFVSAGNERHIKFGRLRFGNSNEVAFTLTATGNQVDFFDYIENYKFINGEKFNNIQNNLISSFPLDYEFNQKSNRYICGMSVPPVMVAQIASEIYVQWLAVM